jgi:fluoroacetyl-CoA thioesterase
VKDTLDVGISNETTYTVTKDMSASHLPAVVLSTPSMVGLIEGTCLSSVQSHLDDGEVTVGTHVCVSHEAAVLEDEGFAVRSRLVAVEGRRLKFDVEVEGPRGTVSRGTHERAVIKRDRFGPG